MKSDMRQCGNDDDGVDGDGSGGGVVMSTGGVRRRWCGSEGDEVVVRDGGGCAAMAAAYGGAHEGEVGRLMNEMVVVGDEDGGAWIDNYVRMAPRGLPSCGLAGNHSADMVSRIEVLSPITKPNQNGKTKCCDVVATDGMDVEKIKLRDCEMRLAVS
ncbi:hypothetical protein Tco_0072441 [Tanacetum coccineum]